MINNQGKIMSTKFIEFIAPIIQNYKKILKKSLPQEQYEQKVNDLGIKRMQLRKRTEADLFAIAQIIIKDLEMQKCMHKKSNRVYSGYNRFIHDIKVGLKDFILQKDKVIDITHESSCAMVEAIQLIGMAEEKNDAKIKLESLIKKIVHYGVEEEITALHNILKSQSMTKKKIFASSLELLEANDQILV